MMNITMPDKSSVPFPDNTPPQQIRDYIRQKYPQDYAAELKNAAASINSGGGMSMGDVASGAIENFPKSAVQFGEQLYQGIAHPIETVETLGRIGKGAMQKIGLWSGKDSEPYAEAFGKMLSNRYGGIENIMETASTDPVGMAADFATMLSLGGFGLVRGGAAVAGMAGKVAGTAGKVAGVAGDVMGAAGKMAQTVAPYVDPLSVVGKTAKVAGKGIGAMTKPYLTPEGVARSDLARNMPEMTPQQADQAVSMVGAKPGVMTLADIGGQGIKDVTERVAQTPGAGRAGLADFFSERQKAQFDRVSNDLRELTGESKSAFKATEETMKAQKDAATPLYAAAYGAGDKPVWTGEMQRLTSVPEVQDAMHSAVRGWQRSQIADGYGAMNPMKMSAKTVGNVDVGTHPLLDMMNKRVPVFPNLQFWDYTKKALDDIIKGEIKDNGTMTNKGRELVKVKNSLVSEIDSMVPEYKAARDAWAGPQAFLDKITEGKDILTDKVGSEELAANFKTMSESEKQGYRIGAISSIINKIGKNPNELANFAYNISSRPNRAKISAMMPTPEAAARWNARLNAELETTKTASQALHGSQTARRTMAMKDNVDLLDNLAMEGAAAAGVHTLTGGALFAQAFFRKAIRYIPDKWHATVRERADKATADMLKDPNILAVIDKIKKGPEPIMAQHAEPFFTGGQPPIGPRGLGRTALYGGRLQQTRPYPEAPQGYPYTQGQ